MAVAEVEGHPAQSHRQKLAKIDHEFRHIPVRAGTQQAAAIEQVREASQVLAKQIAVLCPEGDPATDAALQRVLEAKFWAVQAITHRKGGSDT